jgi:nitrite reductase (NO-forming)
VIVKRSIAHILAGAGVVAGLGACQRQQTPSGDAVAVAGQASPTERPPANVSHGEAPIGADSTSPPVDPVAPGRTTERAHKVRFEMRHATITIAPDVAYQAWTFNGRVPGPVIRVTEGDTVDFTLVNKAPMPHSMDFHAAEIAPSRWYTNVMPNDSLHYKWVARVPGAFLYHCGTAPVAAHIANGMYGAIIVDPRTPRSAAREFVIVQSEFYMTPDTAGGGHSLSWERVLGQAPDNVVFNGHAAQYAEHPIRVTVGEPLRLYVVDAGPNRTSDFHVVGAIFEKVFMDGSTSHPLEGVQTVDVPVGGGAIFEVRLKEAGFYPFVTHAFADATKGATGVFQALAR